MGRIILRNQSAVNDIDPATLNLSLYLRAAYAGSPWTSTASAGTSGGRTASEATNPPSIGAALNGLATASFDGANDQLTLNGTGGDYYTSASLSGFALIKPTAAQTATGAVVNDPAILADNGGAGGLTYTNEGVTLYVQTSGGLKTAAIPVPTGVWSFVSWRYTHDGASSGSVQVGRNGAPSATSTANDASNLDPSFRTVYVGRNYNAAKFFNGLAAVIALTPAQFTNDQFVGIYNHLRTEFAL